jgi:hypothetical protein
MINERDDDPIDYPEYIEDENEDDPQNSDDDEDDPLDEGTTMSNTLLLTESRSKKRSQ